MLTPMLRRQVICCTLPTLWVRYFLLSCCYFCVYEILKCRIKPSIFLYLFPFFSDDYPDQEAIKELRQATKKIRKVRGKREQDLTEETSNKLNQKRTRTKKSKLSVDDGTEEPHTGKATEDSDLIGDSTEDKRSSS